MCEKSPPNNGMQLTALRAAADAGAVRPLKEKEMDQPKPSEGEHFTRPGGMTLLAAILGLLTVGYFMSFVHSLPDDALLIDGLVKAFSADGFTQLI